jgi:branched-chain amino acid transport system permease protein
MSWSLADRQVAAALAFFAVLAALPLVLGAFHLTVLSLVFLSAFLGIAWNLMMGFAGQLSLGHALYFGIGAYVQAILSERYGVSPWLAMLPAAALPALLGVVIGALGFRFAVRGVYFALLTIAFAEFGRLIFEHWGFVGRTGGFFLKALTAENQPLVTLRGGPLFFYYALLLTVVASFVLSVALMHGPVGYCWRAIREDEDASRALGVRAFPMKLLAVAISAALTGIGGAWFALMNGSIFPDSVLGMQMSINLIIAPIVGGLGTLFGPIVGAFIVVPINELSRDLAQSFSINGLNLFVFGILLMVVIKIGPHGCWPWLARRLRLAAAAWKPEARS